MIDNTAMNTMLAANPGSKQVGNERVGLVAYSTQKFTSQEDMGKFLVVHYNIRTPKDLTSCEVCHR
jgi:hypothetical protein